MSKSLKLIIEALLFSSDKPLTLKDIKDCLRDTDAKDIKSALAVLEHDFDVLERSFEIKEVAGGFQLRSRPEYGSYILRLLQSTPNRLSRAAMETLAIIAYKQPILRHEIEKLRGVDVGGILKTLMEKDLVKIMGRKDLPGKPLIYGTTKRFLEVFDLRDISDLPKMNEIKDFGMNAYEPTPLNQDNPLEPQGTEGLMWTVQTAETAADAPERGIEQDQPITRGKSTEGALNADQGYVPDDMPVETQDADEIISEEPYDLEEAYGDSIPDDANDVYDEDYEEADGEEEYNEMNGDYYSDDDSSEDGNEDDTKD
jgi:segregation and condensation protein B